MAARRALDGVLKHRTRAANQEPAALAKGLRILSGLTPERPNLTVAQFAQALGVSRMTVYRLLRPLIRENLIRGRHGRYGLGFGVLRLYDLFEKQIGVRDILLPLLTEVVGEVGETSSFLVRDQLKCVPIARVESESMLRLSVRLGAYFPLHTLAAGKLLLAYAPEPVRGRVLSHPLSALTPNTITDPEVLKREMEEIRGHGFATSWGETDALAGAVAVPVRDSDGQVIGALDTAGPSERLRSQADTLIAVLSRAAGRVETALSTVGADWVLRESAEAFTR